MNRSKNSFWREAGSASAAAMLRLMWAIPTGVASPLRFVNFDSKPASGARHNSAAKSKYSCERAMLVGSAWCIGSRPKISGRRSARDIPVTDSTSATRSTGTRFHMEMAGCETPRLRASALTPPATSRAFAKPGSRIVSSPRRMISVTYHLCPGMRHTTLVKS